MVSDVIENERNMAIVVLASISLKQRLATQSDSKVVHMLSVKSARDGAAFYQMAHLNCSRNMPCTSTRCKPQLLSASQIHD